MCNKEKCPFCNKFNTVPIIYGTPIFEDVNDWDKVKNGEIILGSECRPLPRASHFCRNCNKEFGNYDVEIE